MTTHRQKVAQRTAAGRWEAELPLTAEEQASYDAAETPKKGRALVRRMRRDAARVAVKNYVPAWYTPEMIERDKTYSLDRPGHTVYIYHDATSWLARLDCESDETASRILCSSFESSEAAMRWIERNDYHVPLVVACAASGYSKQRISRLVMAGKVRRETETLHGWPGRPRWLYHLGDLLEHRRMAKPGRPRRD